MSINRYWLADTLALITFTVVTGLFIEITIVGMTLRQSLASRLMCQPVNITLGRLYGLYRDKVIARTCRKANTPMRRAVGDILSYVSFQLPFYIAILMAVGMDAQGILTASISQVFALLILGAPYGRWLEFVREKLVCTRNA